MKGLIGERSVICGIEAVCSHCEDVIHAAKARSFRLKVKSSRVGRRFITWCVPVEQRVGDGLQVLQCAFLDETKYLNLAFVLRVIDDEEVDRVIYKTVQC